MELVVENPAANAGDIRNMGLIPGWERSPGGGHSNPLQYSCLENPMDRGAWWAIVLEVANSWTQLKQLSMHTHNNDFILFLHFFCMFMHLSDQIIDFLGIGTTIFICSWMHKWILYHPPTWSVCFPSRYRCVGNNKDCLYHHTCKHRSQNIAGVYQCLWLEWCELST